MRVAIATEDGQVGVHFGRCPEYTIVDIQDNKVVKRSIFENPGHGGGCKMPKDLKEQNVDVVIAGGMGAKAIALFNEYGIKPFAGISGTVEDVLNSFLKGSLKEGESLCKPDEHHSCSHHEE